MNNIIFTIDEKESKLKLIYKKNDTAMHQSFRLEPDELGEGVPNYEAIFSRTLNEFFRTQKIGGTKLIYVLPDKYVFYDYIETPTIFGKRQQDILRLELATRFPMQGTFKTVLVPIEKEKGKVTCVAYMAKNPHLIAIHNALKRFRFTSHIVTFESAMIANAFLNCDPPRKNTQVMYAAILEETTKVVVVKEGQLLFFTEIPYGMNVGAMKEKSITAPAVLHPAAPDPDQQDALGEALRPPIRKGPTDNNRFLLRTLGEMFDIVSTRYHMNRLALKYCIDDAAADTFARSAMVARMEMKRVKLQNLTGTHAFELNGACFKKIYYKGLLL